MESQGNKKRWMSHFKVCGWAAGVRILLRPACPQFTAEQLTQSVRRCNKGFRNSLVDTVCCLYWVTVNIHLPHVQQEYIQHTRLFTQNIGTLFFFSLLKFLIFLFSLFNVHTEFWVFVESQTLWNPTFLTY